MLLEVLSVPGMSERVRPQCEGPDSLEGRLGVAVQLRTLESFRPGTAGAAAAGDLYNNNIISSLIGPGPSRLGSDWSRSRCCRQQISYAIKTQLKPSLLGGNSYLLLCLYGIKVASMHERRKGLFGKYFNRSSKDT